MSEDKSFSDSVVSDAGKAAEAAKETADAAKAVAKAASQLAAGNAAGAAVTAIKDSKLLRTVLAVFLAMVLLFMFAMPMSIFMTAQKTLAAIAQKAADVRQAFLDELYLGTDGRVGSVLRGIVAAIRELFSGSDGYGMSSDGIEGELFVFQSEEETTKALDRKISEIQKKVDGRMEELRSAVTDSAAGGALNSVCWSRFNAEHGNDPDAEYGGVEVITSTSKLSKLQAIRLLALYSVQHEGNVDAVELSDLMKWLGYYDGFQNHGTGFYAGQTYISCRQWQGTCLPQYLQEQLMEDTDTIGEAAAQATYASKMCPAVDLLISVEMADPASAYVGTYTRQELIPTPVPSPAVTQEPDSAAPTPTPEPQYRTITTYTYYISVSIRTRTVNELSQMLGMWAGSLDTEQDNRVLSSEK